jgi:hypothetical protein
MAVVDQRKFLSMLTLKHPDLLWSRLLKAYSQDINPLYALGIINREQEKTEVYAAIVV